jgi:hypothetical protein
VNPAPSGQLFLSQPKLLANLPYPHTQEQSASAGRPLYAFDSPLYFLYNFGWLDLQGRGDVEDCAE